MTKQLRFSLPIMAAFLFMGLSFSANADKPTDPPEPEPSPGPDRMIVLGDDEVSGIQIIPFTSINSLWCRPENRIDVSYIRISDNQIFTAIVDANPADFDAACKAWLDYLNGSGPQPPINP
jgi:hypothetical protein